MKDLFDQLQGLDAAIGQRLGGAPVQLQPIAGDVPVVQITIDGRQELPIFLTSSSAQILCMCYLWSDDGQAFAPDGAAGMPAGPQSLGAVVLVRSGRQTVCVARCLGGRCPCRRHRQRCGRAQ